MRLLTGEEFRARCVWQAKSFLKTPKGQMELTATHYTKLVLYLHIAQYSDFYHQLRWYCLLANELVILALIKRCVYWIFVFQVSMCQLLRLKMSQNLYCMIHESYLLSADALMQEGYKCTRVYNASCRSETNIFHTYPYIAFFLKDKLTCWSASAVPINCIAPGKVFECFYKPELLSAYYT